MKIAFSITACAAAALAAPPSEPQTKPQVEPRLEPAPPDLSSLAPGRSRRFYVNREPNIYCPPDVSGLNCDNFNGSDTKLIINNSTATMSLDVTVPGGQQVYVAPDGSLSFTQAHSASMPPGSIVTGFSRARSESFGAPINLYFNNQFWYLCPVTEGPPRERTYQIFTIAGGLEGCYGTQIRTYTPGAGNIWQYN
ncbi:hypothetical protein NUW58_g5131 [Xylaria curta]|uniref:Uncharacterized protein n=1 Tax=Xylaria curta TaxID=42375 RepID=A0ACC1P4D5_9PEZI|nr:hypothetical protein NUW58_g5131 [Xylaria curta]